MPLQRSESSSCRPLHRGFSPQWTFPMGARLPPHGAAVRGRTQNFLPGSWLKILWPVHLTLDRWNGRGLRLPPGKSTAGNRPQEWRQEGGLLRHQAQFPHTPSGVQGAQVTARQGRRDRNGRCKPGVLRQGWKPARAETAPLAPFTTARPAWGTPGKAINRRGTERRGRRRTVTTET